MQNNFDLLLQSIHNNPTHKTHTYQGLLTPIQTRKVRDFCNCEDVMFDWMVDLNITGVFLPG